MIISQKILKLQNSKYSYLSIFSIGLLIFATVIVSIVISQNPIIILNIAQIKSGQRDLILYPIQQYFNTSKISQIIQYPVMPRIKTDFIINSIKYSGILMDFNLQSQQNLGSFKQQLQYNHNYIYIHKQLNLIQNQSIKIQLSSINLLSNIINQIILNNQILQQDINKLKNINFNNIKLGGQFIIKKIYQSTLGKIGQSQLNNQIYIDINYAIQQMINQTFINSQQQSAQILIKYVNKINLAHLATQATINMPNRYSLYKNADSTKIIQRISQYCQYIIQKIGIYSIIIKTPIIQQYQFLQYFSMFINTMLKLIIISLFILSTIMTYNLILIKIQQKKYQLSIYKLLGSNRYEIIIIILIDTIKHSIIGNIISIPFIIITIQIINYYIDNIYLQINLLSFIEGLLIGILVPILSSLLLINKINQNNLISQLTQKQFIYKNIKTQVYIQEYQFPIYKFIFGILSLFYGLLIYYLLPYGMINQNLALLSTLFFTLLWSLIIGLIIISYSIQYILQDIMARIIYFWINKTDKLLLLKNLSSHRIHNRLTSILYALSISFIIVISVGFHLQLDATKDQFIMMMGGDIDIGGRYVNPYIINNIVKQIQQIKYNTYITMTVSQYHRKRGNKVLISDKSKLFFLDHDIYGVMGNFINIQTSNTFQMVYTQSKQPYNIYTYLNTQNGDNTCIISYYAASKMGILSTQDHQFYINIYYKNYVKRYPINYTSILRKRKGLYYTAYMLPTSNIGISMQTYKKLTNINFNQDLPIQRSKIYVKNKNDIDKVVKKIKNQLNISKQGDIDYMWDRLSIDQNMNDIKSFIDFIMAILLTFILIICYFSLLTNIIIKTKNQEKQVGMLLMLGYEKQRIFRLYKMETFLLILNASFKGILCGYIVSLLMAWQRELFSSVVVELTFNPYFLFIILLSAFVSSQISSTKALERITNKNINENLRSI